MAIPVPDLYTIEHVLNFMDRKIARVMPVTRNDLIRALHNSWLNITVPCLHNLYNSHSRKVRAVIRGRGYPTRYWSTKYFRKKDNIWICLTFPERNILLLQIVEVDVNQRLIWHFPGVASFLSGECIWQWYRDFYVFGTVFKTLVKHNNINYFN